MKRNCYKNKQTSLLTQDGMPPLNQAVTLESAPETLLHFAIQQIQRNVAKHPKAVWHENNQQPMKGELQSQCKSMKDYLNINCTKHERRDGLLSGILMHSRM